MAQYVVSQNQAGKTLKQLGEEASATGQYVPRIDILAGQLGVSQDSPLTAGQAFNLPDDPGSGEIRFASSIFTPYATYQKGQDEAFATKQKAEEQGFLDALNAKVAGQETLTAGAERIGGELNLPALRESAFGLTQTLKNIPGVQKTISKQVGISAPNLQKRIAAEQGEIAPLAQEAVSQQQFGEQELGTRLGYLLADQAKELEPFYKAQLPLLSDRLAREQTNYSQAKQDELTLLLTRMDQGFKATQADLDRANSLAMNENQYNQAKNTQSIETIGGRRVLVTYDNTGQSVSKVDLGSSTAGTTPVDPTKYTGGGNKPTLQELEGTA